MTDEIPAAGELLTLQVTDKRQIAQGIHQFELRRPDGGELPEFTAGAHVAIHLPDGPIRKYSLCNDPAERDRYVMAVKREDKGRGGSAALIDRVRKGDRLQVAPPVNDFPLPRNAQTFIFIAGGIGITPIMSMMRYLNSVEGKQYRLYYCTRSPEMTAFLHELNGPKFRGKVTIHHDGGDPARALDLWPIVEERKNRAHLYCCGPWPLMQAVRDVTGHWSAAAVHFEAFAEPQKQKADDHPFLVELAKSGETLEVPVGKTIVEVMRANGYDVPTSCESGTCGTCRTRLISGEADHRDLVLAEHERADQIMICVSRARGGKLVIDR